MRSPTKVLRVRVLTSTPAPRALREKGRRGSAAEAASGIERIHAEKLVDQAASDTQHCSTAVVTLGVELESLELRVIVALPDFATDVSRGLLQRLGLTEEGRYARVCNGPRLRHACHQHDLQPASSGGGLERSEAADRHVGKLEARRRREVAREADAGVDEQDVDEAKHSGAGVLDLHDLVAAHVARGNEAEGVPHAERRRHTNVALGEHLRR
mmetsp:Transcript_43007/g.100775  ORF Transcript_43007/g.100775 Transcript_43007/m.100775 type:complete len:213 (+) Transcript_43007:306-944(+)